MNHLVNNALKMVKANTPEILTAIGVGGVISTGVLAAKAAIKASNPKYDVVYVGAQPSKKKVMLDKAKMKWKVYVPPVLSGAATIAAIIASNKTGGRRTAAAVTAYSLTEKAFTEYRQSAVEKFGESQERRMRDDMAQAKVSENPVTNREVLVVGKGQVLCFDSRSVRYFRSSMEELKRAQNDINYQLNHERYVSLSEFYIMIGLPVNKESVYNGWTLDRGLMELDISTTISEDEEPCLVIDFNYVAPLHDEISTREFPPCET